MPGEPNPTPAMPNDLPPPVVSIIIVTYNALDYVKRCLETVRRHSHVPHEILVIDNLSQPETREFLQAQTGIRLFLNEENLLWCGGCNQGMREAHPASRYFLLLNPDTEVLRSDWLEVLIRVIESEPRVGIVGTKHQYKEAGPVYGWIDGQCFMVRRELVEEIGYFDCKRFPMGGAPQLFTIKAFKKGWTYKAIHRQDHLIVHHRGKSRPTVSGPKPWKEEKIVFEDLMREEGLEPQIVPGPIRLLRRKFYTLRVRGRFFYTPPS